MAHLTCKNHGKRVFVIENPRSIEFAPVADVFHRNVIGTESVKCDSAIVVIDGYNYRAEDLLDWKNDNDNSVDKVLAEKADALIYS